MTVVGGTYTKLENFLAAIAATQQTNEENTAAAEDAATSAGVEAAVSG
jgi:hypothetical protein